MIRVQTDGTTSYNKNRTDFDVSDMKRNNGWTPIVDVDRLWIGTAIDAETGRAEYLVFIRESLIA